MRSSSCVLLVGLCVSCVLSVGLPRSWGQANGLLEMLEKVQALTLLLGLFAAWMAARRQRGMVAGKIWWVLSLGWLTMLVQALLGGAVSDASLASVGAAELVGSLGAVSWKPVVQGICLGMGLLGLYWVLRHRLVSRVVLRWLRERAMPWGCLLVAGLAMLLSVLLQEHGSAWMQKLPDATAAVMGKAALCWAYAALWWAQWVLLHHMQDWRSSSYLQTMHFSLAKGVERRVI